MSGARAPGSKKIIGRSFSSSSAGWAAICSALGPHSSSCSSTRQVDEKGQKRWPVSHYQQEGERISNWFAEGVIKQHRKLSSDGMFGGEDQRTAGNQRLIERGEQRRDIR
jgi:hypothetical protein